MYGCHPRWKEESEVFIIVFGCWPKTSKWTFRLFRSRWPAQWSLSCMFTLFSSEEIPRGFYKLLRESFWVSPWKMTRDRGIRARNNKTKTVFYDNRYSISPLSGWCSPFLFLSTFSLSDSLNLAPACFYVLLCRIELHNHRIATNTLSFLHLNQCLSFIFFH